MGRQGLPELRSMISSVLLLGAGANSRMFGTSTDMWLNPPCTPGNLIVRISRRTGASWPRADGSRLSAAIKTSKNLIFIGASYYTCAGDEQVHAHATTPRSDSYHGHLK